MSKKSFPISEIQVLIDEYDYSIEKLAVHFKTSRPTMGKFLKENNILTKRNQSKNKIAQLDKNLIISKYQDGETINSLAKEFNVSTTSISNILKNAEGVAIRTNSKSHTKYACDINYFNTIDSANKAYLLGFICADGFTTDRNEIGIEVAPKDYEIVEFFKKELKSNKPIQRSDLKYGLRIQNKQMCDILKSYGIVPRKSLILNISETIQKANLKADLIPSFLLGYFDGDGGIYKYEKPDVTTQFSCSITGTLETCNYYKKFFNDIGFLTKRHKDEKNNYTYQIGGRNQVKKALSTLYSAKFLPEFWYQRKYEKFLEL